MTTRPPRWIGLLFALLTGAASAPLPAAGANTLCVNQGGTGGCKGTIAAAISAAANGDTIRIAGAANPYFERLTITKSLSLVGDDPATTIVDGAAAGQVIRITGAIVVTLTNLTIQNGQAGAGNLSDQYGGGIHSEDATLTLNNVVVTGNRTGGGTTQGGNGGGIYTLNGSLTLNHSVVSGNTTGTPDNNATGDGGPGGDGAGIDSKTGAVTINDSTISDNFAGQGGHSANGKGGAGGNGGGIAILGGTLALNRSTITDNASGMGGDGDPLGGNGGNGAGIYSTLSNVTVNDSTISFNGTGRGGTGVPTGGQSGNGAGLYAFASTNPLLGGPHTVTMANSTLSSNQTGGGLPNPTGGDGGGIYNTSNMTVTLTNVTLAFNSSDVGQIGGALANGGGTVFVKNSLLADNQDNLGTLHDCSGTITSLGYNIMTAPDCTIAQTTGDQFDVSGNIIGPLQDNGGPTFTHALPPGSPAIDAADNSTCPAIDQRGFKRPAFGGLALRCDVGAYELYRFGLNLPAIRR